MLSSRTHFETKCSKTQLRVQILRHRFSNFLPCVLYLQMGLYDWISTQLLVVTPAAKAEQAAQNVQLVGYHDRAGRVKTGIGYPGIQLTVPSVVARKICSALVATVYFIVLFLIDR